MISLLLNFLKQLSFLNVDLTLNPLKIQAIISQKQSNNMDLLKSMIKYVKPFLMYLLIGPNSYKQIKY